MSPFSTSFSRPNVIHHSAPVSWVRSNQTLLNIASFVFLLIFGATYIIQINQSVSKGYQIREIESEISELTLRNQKLEVVTQQAQSLENVERATKMLGLVRAERPTYVLSSTPSYALAESK
ncbi:hypothetical protein HYV69_02870 [Candidatus Uhrbacteria bacterium]|nr:hypothetical protein [Candidatus Uhrbacteria bacterium]